MYSDVVEVKIIERKEEGKIYFYQRHENGCYTRKTVKIKPTKGPGYNGHEEIEFVIIKKETFDKCPDF